MPIAFPGVVHFMPARDFCEERTWIFGQGVEREAIDDDNNCLQGTSYYT